MKLSEDMIPLSEAIALTCIHKNIPVGSDNPLVFMQNIKGCAESVGHVAGIMATKDDAIERCIFKQIAKAAMYLSMATEAGKNPGDVVDSMVRESNLLMEKRAEEAIRSGKEIHISDLMIRDNNITSTVRSVTNGEQKIKKTTDS